MFSIQYINLPQNNTLYAASAWILFGWIQWIKITLNYIYAQIYPLVYMGLILTKGFTYTFEFLFFNVQFLHLSALNKFALTSFAKRRIPSNLPLMLLLIKKCRHLRFYAMNKIQCLTCKNKHFIFLKICSRLKRICILKCWK